MKASLIKFYYLTKTYQAHILRSASPKYFFPPFIDFTESQLLTFFFFLDFFRAAQAARRRSQARG